MASYVLNKDLLHKWISKGVDELSFQNILQCGYCIFLSSSCLCCHPCGLPGDDLKKCRNVIHLPAIDKSDLSPSLFDSPKKSSYILLWFIHLICSFYLSRYYESCVFLLLAWLGKLVSLFADTLCLGLWTMGYDRFTTYEYLRFAFILWCFFVFLCSWVCSNVSRISIQVLLSEFSWSLPDSLLETCLTEAPLPFKQENRWAEESCYYGDSHCWF